MAFHPLIVRAFRSRWGLVLTFVALTLLLLGLTARDIRGTLRQTQRELVATAEGQLTQLRDHYVAASDPGWLATWADLRERLQGTGVLRIYARRQSIAFNRDFSYYPYDSPACRRFETSSAPAWVVCALYNDETRRLQLALAWNEPEWAPVRAGDIDPAKGDRIRIRMPEVTPGEIVASPQVGARQRQIFERCAEDWRGHPSTRLCRELPVSVFRVVEKTRLLGTPLPQANGLAYRSHACPVGVPAPCVRMLVTLLLRPPPPGATLCVSRGDAADRAERAAVVATTCDASSGAPRLGTLVAGSRPQEAPPATGQCSRTAPCICETNRPPDRDCLPVESSDPPASDRIPNATPTVGEAIARTVLRAVMGARPIEEIHASVALSGSHGGVLGYVTQRLPMADVVAATAPLLATRLLLYLSALLTPAILAIATFAVLQSYAARTVTAEHRQQAAEATIQLRDAQVARDEALARTALADAALRNSTSSLEDLGHEIISPARSLSLISLELRQAIAGQHYEATLKSAFLDLIEGYVRRITKAADRVKQGLQMQRRHAAAVQRGAPVALGAYLHRRLQGEQLVARLPYRLDDRSEGALIQADLGDLEEIIGNLIANARRFATEAGLTISLQIEHRLLHVSLRNEGPIIARGEEEHIFGAGVAIEPDTSETSHGLGLFLVRRAISTMGGTIVAVNDPEPATHGVAFKLTFPTI